MSYFKGLQEVGGFIRWLNCLSAEKIETIFGSEHFALKLLVTYNRDAGRFITSLDSQNLNILVTAYLESQDLNDDLDDA